MKGCTVMQNALRIAKALIYPLAKKKAWDKNMVIDYKNQNQMKKLGFKIDQEYGRVYVRVRGGCDGVTFRNFPIISAKHTDFTNCVFENTESIEFLKTNVKNCTFRNVSEIDGGFTDFSGCTFVKCCSQGPFLTIDRAGSIEGCTFESITALGLGGNIIRSIYDDKEDVRLIKNCKFFNCQADSFNYTHCVYFVLSPSFKIQEIKNLDTDSCDFGECAPMPMVNFEVVNTYDDQ